MKTFSATAANGSMVFYQDRKRWLYWSGVMFSSIPFFSVLLYFSPLGIWATLIPFLFFYAVVPIADILMGEDSHNPPAEVVQAMIEDPFYLRLVRFAVVACWFSFLAAAWLVGTQDLPVWAILALAIGVGSNSGNGLNAGHELGHKSDRLNKLFAVWGNASVGYAHFRVEHNRGHHVWVSTPVDPASSRLGESIYRFVLREIPGAWKRAWESEAARINKAGKRVWSLDNEVIQGVAITLSVAVILVSTLGWDVLPFALLHHMMGWYMLTQANYVEHYGLLRQKMPNGHYEPCRPHHSWNTNHIFSNLMSFHLQRHSDHHTNPMRPYQALRDFPDLPRLPSGYPGMFVLAAIPPLFFKVMDPKVMAWAGGDISRVNVSPHLQGKIATAT
jgi:alkane 1-monooxygenase